MALGGDGTTHIWYAYVVTWNKLTVASSRSFCRLMPRICNTLHQNTPYPLTMTPPLQ